MAIKQLGPDRVGRMQEGSKLDSSKGIVETSKGTLKQMSTGKGSMAKEGAKMVISEDGPCENKSVKNIQPSEQRKITKL